MGGTHKNAGEGGPPDLLDHLFLSLGLLLCLLHLSNILGSNEGQNGTPCCPARSLPTAPMSTHLPEDDTGVAGTSKSSVIQPAAVKPPDLVMVGIQCPNALIVLDGPEFYKPVRAAGFGIARGLSTGAWPPAHTNPCPVPSPLTWTAAVYHSLQRPPSTQKHHALRTSAGLGQGGNEMVSGGGQAWGGGQACGRGSLP